MKKLILVLLLLQYISCDTRFDGDIRYEFTGKVMDENNNPIENKEVVIYTSTENSYYNFHKIGLGKTDSNGNYSVFVPASTNITTYSLEINSDFDSNYNSQLIGNRFFNITKANFLNNKIQLPSSKLFSLINISNLQVQFNKINSNNDLLFVEFNGEIANDYVEYNPTYISNEYSKKVKKNQTIEIKYKVKNQTNSVITEISSYVTIDNSSTINHTIYY